MLLVGPPKTGKTSFLALLWLAIANGRSKELALASHQDDRAYLNEIAERLQRCEPALHTEYGENRELHLHLLMGQAQDPVLLNVPDLSGEIWLETTYDRRWTSGLDSLARESAGLVIFVHARDVSAEPMRNSVGAVTAALIGVGDSDEEQPGAGEHTDDHKQARPTQVELVDALQLICEQRGARPYYVAIVISAWDLVDGATLTPEAFVGRNLPLVHQYVSAHSSWLRLRVFGLSAQGGDFDQEEMRAELVHQDAVARSHVAAADGSEVEIHDVVMWALGRVDAE